MAFGQQSGPPATARQVEQLRDLFVEAGFADFREARHPFGLTQRQAGGKFTRSEAEELIEHLEARRDAGEPTAARETPTPTQQPRPKQQQRSQVDALRRVPSEALAAELQRRGWIVVEP